MAPAIGEKGGPIRVFVLVDKGSARGVFLSWDAAETYADEHSLSLDHLYEFVTRPSHPEHLHLLVAEWENGWEFQGEWKKEIPKWNQPPKRVRLDHYHLRGNLFLIFRQKEFNWSTGLLLKIDPMAPDTVLDQIGTQVTVEPAKATQQWRPKLGALNNPARPAVQPVVPEPKSQFPDSTSEVDLGAEMDSASEPLSSVLEKPEKPRLADITEAPVSSISEDTNRLSLRNRQASSGPKRKPLKLKSKETPKPIPDFSPIAPAPVLPSTVSSVELAQMEQSGIADSGHPDKSSEATRIFPLRLIIAIVAAVLGWGGGIFYVFRPQPTAAEQVASIAALNPADVITIEPGQVFFQLPVDPIHQQRWVRSLDLTPIPKGTSVPIPTRHALATWDEANGFIRAPYAEVEVREWWDLRLRDVQYGFTMEWDDGSILILDLESDMMIGWMRAKHLPSILN